MQARKTSVEADPWKLIWCDFGYKRLSFKLSTTDSPPKYGGDAYDLGAADVTELSDKLLKADAGLVQLFRQREALGATLQRNGGWIEIGGSHIGDAGVRFPLAFLSFCVKKAPVAAAGTQMTVTVRERRPARQRVKFEPCCGDAEEAWNHREFVVKGGQRLFYREGDRLLDCPFCLAEIVFKWNLE